MKDLKELVVIDEEIKFLRRLQFLSIPLVYSVAYLCFAFVQWDFNCYLVDFGSMPIPGRVFFLFLFLAINAIIIGSSQDMISTLEKKKQ